MNIQFSLKIFFPLFLLTSLQANYCIQVMSTPANNQETIIKKASKESYEPFDLVRVEQRGNFLVFRIGDYNSYTQAKEDLLRVQKISKDAYIRKCDFIKEKTLFLKNDDPIQTSSMELESKTKKETSIPLVTQTESDSQETKIEKELINSIPSKPNKFGIDESLLP